MRHPLPLIVLATLFAGCGLGETWALETRTDSGVACLEGDADAIATVQVDAQVCLSSSCDRERQAACTATLDGTTITVSSDFSWETATGTQACTDDCGFLIATCEVGPLAAGTYTLVHGSDTTEFTVPTEGDCSPF